MHITGAPGIPGPGSPRSPRVANHRATQIPGTGLLDANVNEFANKVLGLVTLRNLKVHRLVLGAVPHENVGIPLGRSLDKRLDRMAELNLVGLVGEVSNESRKSVEALLDDLARSGVVDLGSGRSGRLE